MRLLYFFYLSRTFRIYDDNGSRMLDYDELKNGVKDYGLNMSKAELDELFSCFDKDNSGTISFDEFILALRVSPQHSFHHTHSQASHHWGQLHFTEGRPMHSTFWDTQAPCLPFSTFLFLLFLPFLISLLPSLPRRRGSAVSFSSGVLGRTPAAKAFIYMLR